MAAPNGGVGTPIPGIPLQSLAYDVRVTGLQQEVTVTQRFGNALDHPVEAVYVFPLPAEATVHAVDMRIGDRTITAELRKREDAVRAYEEARDAGHHAALLEEERPNIFTMSVAGIAPGEAISVTVRYAAPVPWQDCGGRLSIPLVVAPRFIPGVPVGAQGHGWSPDTDEVPDASRITPPVVTEAVPYAASLRLTLQPGFPTEVAFPSHGTMVEPFDLAAREVRTISLDDLRPDRDIICTYRTTAVLPHVHVDRTTFTAPDGAVEEFLLLQLTSGQGQEPTSPLDAVLVLDRSGSMDGPKIAGLKEIAHRTLDRLAAFPRPVRVGVVTYDDRIHAQVPLGAIGEEQRSVIQDIPTRGGGGTQTRHALDAATALLGDEDDDRERCVILVTDGQFGAGWQGRAGVRIHVVGIDTAVNDAFLNDLARTSGGGTYFLRPGEDYDAAATAIAAFASGPVVHEVTLRGPPEDAVVTGVSDLYAGRPTTIAVQCVNAPAECTITGRGSDGSRIERTVTVPTLPTTAIVPRVWAKARLREILDGDARIACSLRYGVVCNATAFVAVSLKEVPGAQPERVNIPVLLPETWDAGAFLGGDTAYLAAGAAMAPVACGLAEIGVPEDAGSSFSPARAISKPAATARAWDELTDVLAGRRVRRKPPSPPPPLLPTQPSSVPPPLALPPLPPLIFALESFLRRIRGDDGGVLEDAEWESIVAKIAAEDFTAWGEFDRAQCYELLVELRAYGRTVAIPDALTAEPAGDAARQCWVRARQGLGHAMV